jgi:uncharacterized protein (DUF433 family)
MIPVTPVAMQKKQDIYAGKSPRELPLYSLAEAARIVRMKPSTVRTWALGRSYPTSQGAKSWPPLIHAADTKARRLSFANLVELHVLSSLRDKEVRVERIRSASQFIRGALKVEHPLADVDAHTDSIDIYVEYLGRLINASTSTFALRPMVERYLERIDRDARGLANRLYPITRDDGDCPRAILIDPARRFGRPVLAAANIETSVIAERFFAGELPSSIAADLQVTEVDVFEAARFEHQLRAA